MNDRITRSNQFLILAKFNRIHIVIKLFRWIWQFTWFNKIQKYNFMYLGTDHVLLIMNQTEFHLVHNQNETVNMIISFSIWNIAKIYSSECKEGEIKIQFFLSNIFMITLTKFHLFRNQIDFCLVQISVGSTFCSIQKEAEILVFIVYKWRGKYCNLTKNCTYTFIFVSTSLL